MRVEEDGDFFSPNDVVVPLPHVQTPDLISGGRNGRGSRDARKVRKWGLKIAVNRSELEEEMGGFGGRAGGRRRGSRDARKVRKWGLKIAVKGSELEEEMRGFGGEVEAGGVSSAAVGEVTSAVGRRFRAQIGRRGK
ncbi:Uncharacterized protein Fot_54033 [Forsythia ovata]|uniref:Uncharacterized protein n=1 Tax=Forsythia ovata TaxID=205694 RepID=A0ABD1PFV7_9LAMI